MRRERPIDRLAERGLPWLVPAGPVSDIALACRATLVRNVAGYPFPRKASAAQRRELQLRIGTAVLAQEPFAGGLQFDLAALGVPERDLLVERELLPVVDSEPEGQAALVTADESHCAVLNETDHLRRQAVRPGLELPHLWHDLSRLESALATTLPFAFDKELGYLTARPEDVGTGLRVSVLMHLPGLLLAERMEQVRNGLEALGLTLAGGLGAEAEPEGNLYEVSHRSCLGESEERTLARLGRVAGDLIVKERHARQWLLENHPAMVADFVGRAYGTLSHARLLSAREVRDLLSAVRLGIDLGLISTLAVTLVNELLLFTRLAHLQRESMPVPAGEAWDIVRATMVRQRLRQAARNARDK